MCHHRYYENMLLVTESANKGLGVCCKPNAYNGLCDPLNEEMVCS